MKQPKKLTLEQKKTLANLGKNLEDWMLLDEDKITYTFINKGTKEVLTVDKG